MVFDFFKFFEEVFVTEASIHDEDKLGGIIFEETRHFEELEFQQGIEAFIDSPSDLTVAIAGLEETDGPSLDGERSGEEEETFLRIFLIGASLGERAEIAIADEAGIDEDGNEFFVLESQQEPVQDLSF